MDTNEPRAAVAATRAERGRSSARSVSPRLKLRKFGRPGVGLALRPEDRSHAAISAFTVIEVVLAIFIAVGLLVVALHFYHQAAELRTQLLREADRLSALRLVLDRVAADLRAARAHDWHGFTGTLDSMRFVTAESVAPSERSKNALTDLRLVSYGASSARDGTNVVVTGLAREDQPLIESRPGARLGEVAAAAALAASTASATNRVVEPITDAIRFLRFRYWDGEHWVDGWDAIAPPRGVQVTFGLDPWPDDAPESEYPFELFRRVVLLPGGGTGGGT